MDELRGGENQIKDVTSKEHYNGNLSTSCKSVNRKRKNKSGQNRRKQSANSSEQVNSPGASNADVLKLSNDVFGSRNVSNKNGTNESVNVITEAANQIELGKGSKYTSNGHNAIGSNESKTKSFGEKNQSNYDREVSGCKAPFQDKRNLSGMNSYNPKFSSNRFVNQSQKEFLSFHSYSNSNSWWKNVKHKNSDMKRNSGLHNALTHGDYQIPIDGKNQRFYKSNSYYKYMNGLRVETDSQPSYGFRRTGRQVASANTLGMFWPKMSPLKQQLPKDIYKERKFIETEEKRAKFDVGGSNGTLSSSKHCKNKSSNVSRPESQLSGENQPSHSSDSSLSSSPLNNPTSAKSKSPNDDIPPSSPSKHNSNNYKPANYTKLRNQSTDKLFHQKSFQNGLGKPFPGSQNISRSSFNYSAVTAKQCGKSPVNLTKTGRADCSTDGIQLDSIKEIPPKLETPGISKEKKTGNKGIELVEKERGDRTGNESRNRPGKPSDPSKTPTLNNQNNKKRPKKGAKFKTYHITLDYRQSFDDQAESMIKQCEMTAGERAMIDLLTYDLYRVFCPLIPDVKPVMFGSIVAGTAFSNSDVDIYLQCSDCLPLGNVRDFIMQYGSAVHKGGLFRHGIKIATARVPIVKAIHNATGKNVDISFVTETSEPHFGLCNSLLVKHLCSVDGRVRKLIMLVLFWAKCQGFVGKYQMSSFSFIMMAVFYLQVVEILPPLYKLVLLDEDCETWPNRFNPDSELLKNDNKESVESLYLGFFTFYSAVRFSEVVISPFAGDLVLGALFDSTELLPECYSLYRRLVKEEHEAPLIRSSMTIQEPFNLSWNTVKSVNPRIMELLQQASQNVCEVFTNFSSNRALYVVHSGYYYYDGKDDSYTWELPCPDGTEPRHWFNRVLNSTQLIFSKILLMDVERKCSESLEPQDSQFCVIHLRDVDEENPVRLHIRCEYLLGVKERSKVVNAYQSKYSSELEREMKASCLFLETLKKKDKKTRFNATLYVARNDKSASAEVTINKCSNRNKWRKDAHKEFVSYLKTNTFKHFLKLTLLNDQMDKQIQTASKTED